MRIVETEVLCYDEKMEDPALERSVLYINSGDHFVVNVEYEIASQKWQNIYKP